jgi:hypothetical protein
MSADNPTTVEKEKLQKFYLASRNLLQDSIVPEICVQRAFEEAIAGFLGNDNWRPTHISKAAVREMVEGTYRNVQRAHGVVGDRLDRYDRTLEVLKGDMMEFDDWWSFWKIHDSTVLITKAEHSANTKFTFEELIPLPDRSLGMFVNAGFSFKLRKKVEMAWIKNTYDSLVSS